MKKAQYTPVLLVIAALLGACSSTPTTTGLLDQTRTDFQVAQNNPKIATYAAVEMNQADEAMKLANAAAADDDSAAEIDNLAYVAKQKIALAQETAKQKSAEAEVANAGRNVISFVSISAPARPIRPGARHCRQRTRPIWPSATRLWRKEKRRWHESEPLFWKRNWLIWRPRKQRAV